MLKSYIRSCRSITHSLKSGLVNLLLYCFSMLKSYIRSCRLDLSLTSLILLPPICTLRARDVYLQNIGYQVLYASFFPLLPSPKKTFDVFQNIYWILYWNQISGLVTHQAHHRPPSNPLRIIIIWCLSKYILKSDIRSCNAPVSSPPPPAPQKKQQNIILHLSIYH